MKKRQGLAAGNMEAWRDSAPRYADWSSYQLNLKLEIGRAPRYADWSSYQLTLKLEIGRAPRYADWSAK